MLTSKALGRIAYQYQKSQTFKSLVRALIFEFDQLYSVLELLQQRLDIDLASGVLLDGIGEIVGQPRPVAFDEDAQNEDGLLPDFKYRILLKAAIFKNFAIPTIDTLSLFGLFVFDAQTLVADGIGFVTITVFRELAQWEKDILLMLFPTAAGVRIVLEAQAGGDRPFTFAGTPSGTGFGSLNTPKVGDGLVGLI